jgi:hypothetical protein
MNGKEFAHQILGADYMVADLSATDLRNGTNVLEIRSALNPDYGLSLVIKQVLVRPAGRAAKRAPS